MRVLTMLALTVILLSSCSKQEDKAQTEKKAEPKTPEQVVDEFIDGGEFHYEMLSASERQEVTRQEWEDEIDFSQYFPKPKLTPASKYYELEQLLISSFGYTVEIKESKSPVQAEVTIKKPRLYSDLSNFSSTVLITEEEAFENALSVFKKGSLTTEKLSYNEVPLRTWEIKGSTVSVGAKKLLKNIREYKQRSKNLKTLKARQKEIYSKFQGINNGDFIYSNRDTVEKIRVLRQINVGQLYEEYKQNFIGICQLYREIMEDYPCGSLYKIEELYELAEIVKADRIIQSTIEVNSSSVQRQSDGYAVFYDWEVQKLPAHPEDYDLIMQATLKRNGDNVHVTLVGSKKLNSGVKKRREGRRLDDGSSLQRPDSVEITYAGISGLLQSDCELVDDEIKCEVRP
ncbi:MAG: hypothetical protein HLX50_14770 [Alteromonadaceae bacterium]|nr:hypothetical protein [Alteromonadaceae bacterium]